MQNLSAYTLSTNISNKDGLLAIVLDDSNFIITVMLYSTLYTNSEFSLLKDGVTVTPDDDTDPNVAIYNNVTCGHEYSVMLTVDGETVQQEVDIDFSGNFSINIDKLFEPPEEPEQNEGGNE